MNTKSIVSTRFLLLTLICITLFASKAVAGGEFEAPTKRYLAMVSVDEIKYHLKMKHVGLDYRELFEKAIANEQIGFMGYHGDSIDLLIYQDIIRVICEEILGVPIRKDFHFLSIPLTPSHHFEVPEELVQEFTSKRYYSDKILKSTFPLNFVIYANHNRCGLNSVENFTKNRTAVHDYYSETLISFFERLGLAPNLVNDLFQIAYAHLDSKSGVLLQVFDGSTVPYAFANQTCYSSYPNGFIAENQQISDYMLDNQLRDFPHELRLLLNAKMNLNPNSPLIIKRYTKIQPSKLKAWEQDLRTLVCSAAHDPEKVDIYKNALINA